MPGFMPVTTFAHGALVAALAVTAPGGTTNPIDTTAPWKTGALWHAQLAEPVETLWGNVPLRQALRDLERSERVAIWLDRRVDPGLPLELAGEGKPLGDVLGRIAQAHGLGVSLFEPVVYLGPAEAAARLRTVAQLRREELRRLPALAAAPFQRAAPSRWDDLAEPRVLVETLGRQAGIEIRGLERVPHDLWPAAEWPAMAWTDRLTLLLFPFDLAFRVEPSGRAVEIVPLPRDVAITRSYPGGSDPQGLVSQWAALAPRSRIEIDGRRIVVHGLVEDHERIKPSGPPPSGVARPAAPSRPSLDHVRIERFTVQNKPLREVLDHVGKQLGLVLQMDESALAAHGIALDRLISLEITNATVDELLGATLSPAGLRFTRRDRTVTIDAQPAP